MLRHGAIEGVLPAQRQRLRMHRLQPCEVGFARPLQKERADAYVEGYVQAGKRQGDQAKQRKSAWPRTSFSGGCVGEGDVSPNTSKLVAKISYVQSPNGYSLYRKQPFSIVAVNAGDPKL